MSIEYKTDHFNHDAHVRRLQDASDELYRHGDSETDKRHQAMAGACRRAASIHRQLQSRISHALQVEQRLERLLLKLEATGPALSTGDAHVDLQNAAREVRRARDTLRGYVAQPNAPWITPTPVMFPRTDDE